MRISEFLKDSRAAATAVVAVFASIMTIGGAALIVDHVWLVGQRDTLKAASDSAAIASTLEMKRVLANDPDADNDDLKAALEPVARAYVVANLQYLSGDRYDRAISTLEVNVQPDRDRSTVDVSVQADLGGFLFTSRLPFLNAAEQAGATKVGSRTEGVTKPVEVVLAIDVSTSMKDTLSGGKPHGPQPAIEIGGVVYGPSPGIPSRMEIVKRAAKDLVAILNPNERDRVAVGVVPWHILVRLESAARQGWDREGWAEYPGSRRYAATYQCTSSGSCSSRDKTQTLPPEPGEDWQGCLDEHRVSLGGRADLPSTTELLDHPSNAPFAKAIFPTLEAVAYECLQPPLPSNLSFQSCYGAEVIDVDKVYSGTPAQKGCADATEGESPVILPLTNDRAAVIEAIDSLTPVGFRTYSTLGVAWGQRLLSSTWKDVWGDDVHPVDPTTDAGAGTRKAIVLLTDGEDNQCGTGDPTCTSNEVGFAREVACTAAKAAGTEIFVVAAMHPDKMSNSLATELQACSSEADESEGTYVFLNNATAESLSAAFAHIAKQLVTVRRLY